MLISIKLNCLLFLSDIVVDDDMPDIFLPGKWGISMLSTVLARMWQLLLLCCLMLFLFCFTVR
jgi:hypothetical protein